MKTEKEIWKDIKGYEGYYQVSSYGNIRSLDRWVNSSLSKSGTVLLKGKPMSGSINQDGYIRYSLTQHNKPKAIFGHVLVAKHFIENPTKLPEVNHIDGIKTNNATQNLEWTDRTGNLKHAYDNKLRVSSMKGKSWKEHPNCRKIAKVCPSTNKDIIIYDSLREAKDDTGTDKSSIIRVCQGKQKTAVKFKWRYVDE